jgi:ABC-type Fe3+-citrate transport system substrate-binding protein
MKKKLAIIVMLLVAGLLLASCAGQNNGEKKLTTGDIEGTWTVSDKSVQSKEFLALDGFILKPDDSAFPVLRGGKIT